jgi:hypothetical protein
MTDPNARHLDIIIGDEGDYTSTEPGPLPSKRPWLGVQFECCNVYTRVYRNDAQKAYLGACPKCAAPVKIPIGPAGTSSRFFRAE